MTGMSVVEPVSVTISASNITENDAPAWSSGTTYAYYDTVIYDHYVWLSTTGSNLGNTPADGSSWWSRQQATNLYRIFDSQTSAQAENSNTITYTLVPALNATAICLLNISGSELTIVVDDGGTEIYNQTYSLIDVTKVSDWWSWTYGGVDYDSDKIIQIPAYAGTDVEITLDAGTGTAKIGEVVMGKLQDIGTPKEANIGIQDFSVKERDQWGGTEIVERDYSLTADYKFFFPKGDMLRVSRLLASLRATPTVWAASIEKPEFGTIIFGYPDTWNAPVEIGSQVFASLRIEGLT